MAATTLPTLLLGGDPVGAPEETFATWAKALPCPASAAWSSAGPCCSRPTATSSARWTPPVSLVAGGLR